MKKKRERGERMEKEQRRSHDSVYDAARAAPGGTEKW